MRRLRIFFCVTLAVCSFAPGAGAQVLSKTFRPRVVGVGTPVRYTVTLKAGVDTEIQDPAFTQPPPAAVEIVDRALKRSRSLLRRQVVTFTCVLRSFETGTFDLPEVEFRYRRKGQTQWQSQRAPAETLEVTSVLGSAQGQARLKDIKGPLEWRRRIGVWYVLLFAALIAACVWYIAVKRKQKPGEELVGQSESAHARALRELEELQQKDYIGKGQIKEYFIEVSSIVRRYLEGRFDVHAPEMTTEEFLRSARDEARLVSAHKDSLENFLRCCDLVKFARYAPGLTEIRDVYVAARNFVEQTRPTV